MQHNLHCGSVAVAHFRLESAFTLVSHAGGLSTNMITLRFVFTFLLALAALSSGATLRADPVEDNDENITGGGAPRVAGGVLTGIDVLMQQNFASLRGKRVGLVTNQTGSARDGRSTIDVLARAAGVKLVALFGPEHGIRGQVQAGRTVRSSRDARTGLPVYSLYGAAKRPSAHMLRGLNALVFDMQDIGSRSYTYISTLGGCMQACAQYGVELIVLDRPNLLGGNRIEGNIRESGFRSFVGAYPIPYNHGLTIGELARMINGRGWAGKKRCRLSVVSMRGYRRDTRPEDTRLPWKATSPNIPYAYSPYFYAATGMVGELSTLSIGIGTAFPFQLAGAPGLDAWALTKELSRRRLAGVSFSPVQWRPVRGAYAGRTCTGVQINFTNVDLASLTRLNFEILDAVRKIQPSRRFFGSSRAKDRMFDLCCGTARVRRLFQAGHSASTIWAAWNTARATFLAQRKPYLLYS
jgi:uncharacterized protein YbbC (DUF1343 family)